MAQHGCHHVRFGPFDADLATGELFHGGLKLALQRKPFEILTVFLQHPYEFISREKLRAAVWAGVHVGADACLNTAIRKLRAALGETAESAHYIETMGKHGYRFVGNITNPANSDSRTPTRLAVLPFEDLTAPPDGSFAHGLTLHVIARLAHKQNGLAIIAPTSVRRYKQTTKGTLQICNELHADYVLTGAVLTSARGGRVRVDVELVERWEERCVWAETYLRPESDPIVIQDDLARHIARSTLRILSYSEQTSVILGIRADVPKEPKGDRTLARAS
jgi:TolB-like protein